MSIDWKAFERDVQQNVARASGEADQSLAAQIASQLKLTQEEVEVMFPRPEDLQALTYLSSDLIRQTKSDLIQFRYRVLTYSRIGTA